METKYIANFCSEFFVQKFLFRNFCPEIVSDRWCQALVAADVVPLAQASLALTPGGE